MFAPGRFSSLRLRLFNIFKVLGSIEIVKLAQEL